MIPNQFHEFSIQIKIYLDSFKSVDYIHKKILKLKNEFTNKLIT